jgi:hypothetical protein
MNAGNTQMVEDNILMSVGGTWMVDVSTLTVNNGTRMVDGGNQDGRWWHPDK